MASYFRRIPYPSVSLAIYVSCLVLVLSFILFEVLDVDGSDFPTRAPASATAIQAADPSHDFKRAHLQALADGWMDSCRVFSDSPRPAARLPLTAVKPVPIGPAHADGYRPTLARASLADPLPSA